MTERGECRLVNDDDVEDENGWCDGSCITVPHRWTLGGRGKCANCQTLGTGDACNDGNCTPEEN